MSDIQNAIDKLAATFEEYKKVNDERMVALEKNGSVPADLDEKLSKIDNALNEQQAIVNDLHQQVTTPTNHAAGVEDRTEAQKAHAEGFRNFMVKGQEDGLKELEINAAINIGTDSDGGFAVPEEIDSAVHDLLVEISPMRQVAMVKQVSTSDYKKLVNTRGTASGWVGEAAGRPETDTPDLAEVVPPMGEIYANPAITQQALDDIMFNPADWLSQEVITEFAKEEGIAFISGDGTNKPRGITNYATAATADGARAFGTLQHVNTGAAGAFAASDAHEVLIDVVYACKAGHRQQGTFAMNKTTLGEVRKMKDGDGNLIWQPGLIAGQPQTLMGYPVVEMEDMPAIAADSLSIAFGNWMAGYMIVDRVGMRTLRDPYTNKPYIHFYTTKRVGGGVIDSEAIKFVRFAA